MKYYLILLLLFLFCPNFFSWFHFLFLSFLSNINFIDFLLKHNKYKRWIKGNETHTHTHTHTQTPKINWLSWNNSFSIIFRFFVLFTKKKKITKILLPIIKVNNKWIEKQDVPINAFFGYNLHFWFFPFSTLTHQLNFILFEDHEFSTLATVEPEIHLSICKIQIEKKE